jgi:hypothetical protein
MRKTKDPLPEIKNEFAEGCKALGCFITSIVLIVAIFSLLFELIKHLRP